MALGSDNQYATTTAGAGAQIDAGLRSYMLQVYNYMASGLALTGIVAWLTAMASVVTGDSGQIVGLGTHDELYANNPTYANLCNLQDNWKD